MTSCSFHQGTTALFQRRRFIVVLVLVIFYTLTCQAQNDAVLLPPSISVNPPKSQLYLLGQSFDLPCQAVGTAPLNYWWMLNETRLTCGIPPAVPGTICDDRGVPIRIDNPTAATNNGYYQCFASNDLGATMSNFLHAQQITTGDSNFVVTPRTFTLNAPANIPCNAPVSVPSASHTWYKIQSVLDPAGVAVVRSAEYLVDDVHGDLYFATPTSSDAHLYKCVSETAAPTSNTGYANVTFTGTAANFGPILSFKTDQSPNPSPVIGLEGQSVSLECFFSGRPTPTIETNGWLKVPFPTGRTTLSNSNTMLTISNLQLTDGGSYQCSTTGLSNTVNLAIEAAPVFKLAEDGPQNINASDGDTVSVHCNAYAIPPASVKWYRNGVELTPTILQTLPKYQLSSDQKTLTISNVCKQCADGSRDLASLQCEARNTHDYVWGQGYLNILLPTKITSIPQDYIPPINDPQLTFACAATSDPSTPITNDSRTWTWRGGSLVESTMYVDGEGSLHVDLTNSENGATICGGYTCTVSNNFSHDSITYQIQCESAAYAASVWWVSLIVVGVVGLLLLLFLLFFFCCYRNEGDAYPVDAKERKNGNDPEEEMRKNDFKDFQRGSAINYIYGANPTSMSYNDQNTGIDTADGYNYPGVLAFNNQTFDHGETDPAPAYDYEPTAFGQLQQHASNPAMFDPPPRSVNGDGTGSMGGRGSQMYGGTTSFQPRISAYAGSQPALDEQFPQPPPRGNSPRYSAGGDGVMLNPAQFGSQRNVLGDRGGQDDQYGDGAMMNESGRQGYPGRYDDPYGAGVVDGRQFEGDQFDGYDNYSAEVEGGYDERPGGMYHAPQGGWAQPFGGNENIASDV